jgi:hypothetical protein
MPAGCCELEITTSILGAVEMDHNPFSGKTNNIFSQEPLSTTMEIDIDVYEDVSES